MTYNQCIHKLFKGFDLGIAARRKFYRMSLCRVLVLSLCAAAAVVTPAFAHPDRNRQVAWNDRPRDQDRAFRATKEGRSMPLPQIERRVVPQMRGADYLGPEFHGRIYRLKFMQNGRVIWVDVDAQSGQIIGKSGE